MISEKRTDNPLNCEQWAALLVDKMDGTLAPEAEAAFAAHAASCRACSQLLEQARQGQEWIKLLEGAAPAAPIDLVARILARTQGSDTPGGPGLVLGGGVGASTDAAIFPPPAAHLRWGMRLLPPAGAQRARLIMTAGMAFFSLALTLSVAGVHLSSVHAAELRPQAMQANMSRSFYGTKKQVISFYDNLRLVYEVESKLQQMRRETDQPAPATQPAPQTNSRPKAKSHAATSPPAGDWQARGELLRVSFPTVILFQGATSKQSQPRSSV